MKGGFVHNRVLLLPIAKSAMEFGAGVEIEVPIRAGKQILFGDLLIRHGDWSVLVEAEMSSRRIASDVEKARSLNVTELWIVVPNPRVRRSTQRSLLRQWMNGKSLDVSILLLSQALQRLRDLFDLSSVPNVQ